MVLLLTTYHFRLKYACLKILQGCHASTCVPNYEISIEELHHNYYYSILYWYPIDPYPDSNQT